MQRKMKVNRSSYGEHLFMLRLLRNKMFKVTVLTKHKIENKSMTDNNLILC